MSRICRDGPSFETGQAAFFPDQSEQEKNFSISRLIGNRDCMAKLGKKTFYVRESDVGTGFKRV